MEYELIDTGVFDDDRYFDVFVEYAKDAPEDILISITAVNRGPEPPTCMCCPTLWFRNTWTSGSPNRTGLQKPHSSRREASRGPRRRGIAFSGTFILNCDGDVPLLFTENETNNAAHLRHAERRAPYVKDGINDFVVHGKHDAVNPERTRHQGRRALPTDDWRRQTPP